MSDERRALGHLLLGVEELLRAGAEAAAALRTQSGAASRTQGTGEPSPLLDSVRRAVEREVTRWELRSDDDPAAQRVRDLFAAILDVIGSPAESRQSEPVAREGPEERARRTRPPVRGVQR